MRIFLIRHGHSEGNKSAKKYAEIGDPNIALTDKGWAQAIAAGQFLNSHIIESENTELWTSYFNRTKQTSSGVIYGAGDLFDKDKVRSLACISEQSYGLRGFLSNHKQRKEQIPLQESFSTASHLQDKFWARQPSGESPLDAQMRVMHIREEIERAKRLGTDNLVLVVHGATLKLLAMALADIDPARYAEFNTPENASIYMLEGDGYSCSSLKQVYDGEKMQAVDIDWGEKLGAGEVVLPEVPVHLQNKSKTDQKPDDLTP